MSPKITRKALTSTMEGPEKMQPRSSKRDFFELRGGNGPYLEISEIRLARKANARVQHLSSGNLPMAAFEVTLRNFQNSERYL
jgi:hypothetical protein